MKFSSYNKELAHLPPEFHTLLDELTRLENESGVITDPKMVLVAEETKAILGFLLEAEQKTAAPAIAALLPALRSKDDLHERLLQMRDAFVLQQRKSGDTLIKSVRFDESAFIHDCVEGMIPLPDTPKRKQPLRGGKHQEFTVYAEGVSSREKGKKKSPYKRDAKEIKKRKADLSQHQSTTLITPTVQPPVFGHNKERGKALVGFMFDATDTLMNRMYIYDGGTYDRPYEFATEAQAKKYHAHITDPKNQKLFDDLDQFKVAIADEKNKKNYNEVLARIRWHIASSSIGIFSDTFESRCVAQFYAQVTKQRLMKQFTAAGIPWDDRYQPPISYYMPGNPKHWTSYMRSDQLADRQQAKAMLDDSQKLIEAIRQDNMEFLLLVPVQDIVDNSTALSYLLTQAPPQLRYAILWRSQMEEPATKNTDLWNNKYLTYADARYFATKGGDISVFEQAIKNGLFKDNIDWISVINAAVANNHLDEVKLILRYATRLKIKNLFRANLPPDLLKLVIEKLSTDEAKQHFQYAISSNHVYLSEESFIALIGRNDIDLSVKNSLGETVFDWAVRTQSPALLKRLLEHPRANKNIGLDQDGKMPGLIRLVEEGLSDDNLEKIKILLSSQHIDANAKHPRSHETFLPMLLQSILNASYRAGPDVEDKFVEYIKSIMELKRPDPQIDITEAFEFALSHGQTRIAEVLLEKSATQLDRNKFNDLFRKAHGKNANTVMLKMLSNPLFDPTRLEGNPNPAYVALFVGDLELFHTLIEKTGSTRIQTVQQIQKGLNRKKIATAKLDGNDLLHYALATIDYMNKLKGREKEYEPKYGGFFGKGFGKSQKLETCVRFLNSLIMLNSQNPQQEETTKYPFLKPEDMDVLKNGTFNEMIFSKLPKSTQVQLEKHAKRASAAPKKVR